MKLSRKFTLIIPRLLALISFYFIGSIVMAQDQGIDINVDLDTKEDNWYDNPVMWIIGGAVFILLLVALLRGGKKG